MRYATDYSGGESLDNSHYRQKVKEFKLKGLNKPWIANGFSNVYATVEYGKEDWFHSAFDEKLFAPDRLKALFNMFKDSEDNLWSQRNHKVKVMAEKYLEDGTPINPVIIELILDNI